MRIIGVDPGFSGALAILDGQRLVACIDVPTTGEKAKRRICAEPLLAFLAEHKPEHAFIERAQAMPEQGSSSGFNYGRAVGAVVLAIEGMRIPLTTIESLAWKKAHGLVKREKEDSRQRAIALFPGLPYFARKLDHNRAEAALIARYGAMTLRGIAGVAGEKFLSAGPS